MLIHLPLHLPRDPLAFKGQIDFWKGLRGYIFYGAIFLFMAIVICISCFYPPYQTDLILFKVALGIIVSFGVGFGMFRHVYKKHKERIQAFTHGNITKGIVVAHGTVFVPRKSAKDLTLSIAIPQKGSDFPYVLQARKSDKRFHTQHPIHSEITFLFDQKTKSAFVLAEVDIEIE